jgi:Tfp pilus assembly protein PilN
MKAVNLIPADSKRGGPGGASSLPNAPAIGLLALLTVALAFVTIYVLTSNTMSSRKAKIASTQLQLTEAQAQVARLTNYTQLAQLAAARIQTIRQIATTRFDWYAALSDLSRVVPADTSLQSLVGTVSPDASAGGAGAGVGSTSTGGGSVIRGDIQAPAIELSGCTKTQTDVARLMSRLRLVNGVTRVTLAQSQKQQTAQSGVATSPGGASAQGCGVNAPTFDLVVFFQPLPGAASSTTATAGTASTTAGTATTTTAPTASTATTTPATSTTTTTQSATSSGAGSGGAQ